MLFILCLKAISVQNNSQKSNMDRNCYPTYYKNHVSLPVALLHKLLVLLLIKSIHTTSYALNHMQRRTTHLQLLKKFFAYYKKIVLCFCTFWTIMFWVTCPHSFVHTKHDQILSLQPTITITIVNDALPESRFWHRWWLLNRCNMLSRWHEQLLEYFPKRRFHS